MIFLGSNGRVYIIEKKSAYKTEAKKITDAEFMDDVDNTLHKIDAVIDVKEQARRCFINTSSAIFD